MPEARIAAHDLACRRGDRILFSGLSLALAPGQSLQVAGPNGTGKSSLLRLIAGLSRPFAGRIERQGTMGLVDERPALDSELPLGRALGFWSRIDSRIDGNAYPDLERLGLTDLLDVPVRYLSTGQRKRAALARLLGQRAAVWLLDEPLNGLDVHGTSTVEDITAAHCRAGGIAFVASHQPFDVPGLATLTLTDYAA
jgi:heme exporter protein A